MEPERLMLGAGVQDITPPPGLFMAGYASRTEPATGIHLPLRARAFVCAQGATRAALVVSDVVGLNRETTQELRHAISTRTGIPSEQILIATTHTHAGPVTTKFREAVPDPSYMATLSDSIVAAATEAADSLAPVRMGFAQTEAPQFHHNRRNADQPIDSTLGLVRFVTEDGRPVATWVNYGCHPTILTGDSLLWSSEFSGVMCDMLEEAWGGVPAFFNGCLGDVGPYRPERTVAEVERVGKGLAEVAVALGEAMRFEATAGLTAESVRCKVPLAEAPDRDALRLQAESSEGPIYASAWARDQLRLRASGAPVISEIELEVQAFRIGDLSLACFPGQLFGAWGVELRDRWPDDRLLIINQANDHAGYFPTKVGWERGGYEAKSAFMFNSDLPAPMTWEAGQRLLEAALRFVRD